MELLRLRRRAVLAKKGHKLLKDKLDGLIQKILDMVKNHRHLSSALEEELIVIFQKLILASAQAGPENLYAATLLPASQISVDITLQNIMGVKIPKYELKMEGETLPYGWANMPAELDQALHDFREVLARLVKLAELNKAILVTASTIIEIKRRVNALEYILIPELDAAVRYIRMKLSEMERSNIVSLMKIKDIVRAR